MMTHPPDVSVKLDDRLRLMSALLAATDYPDRAQERKPHGTHAHARATRKQLAALRSHEAVQILQGLLNQNAPLEAMFTLATRIVLPAGTMDSPPRWVPPRWLPAIADFYTAARLREWWQAEAAAWDKSVSEAEKMFEAVSLKPFLEPFVGTIAEGLVFAPNISFPTDQEIGLRDGRDLWALVPPRLAWGESPPWPFDDDPVHICRAAIGQFGRLLMLTILRQHEDKVAEAAHSAIPVSDQFTTIYPTWTEQFTQLFVAGTTAMYLEDHVSAVEANAYLLMERKTRGLDMIPAVVSVLRRYLSERERYESIVDFLPIFPKQLRIAKRIVSL